MLKYWLWLATRSGLGVKGQLTVLSHFGSPEAAYLADGTACKQVRGLNKKEIAALEDKSLAEPEKILRDCFEKNISILTWQDAQYPERLKNIDDPPIVLYYKGRLPAIDSEPVVAMVGSRKASAYGLINAKRLGFQLAKCGVTVASGVAEGIDAMAMTGALTAGTAVIGVLGCGADVIYPRSNARLYRDTEARGCLLTEYPPGTKPLSYHFPARNRILSGLSVGVAVVEASEKSGALITARYALEQGRDVFAVPANIGVAGSMGSNRLLKEGAIYVESGWDIAKEYCYRFPDQVHEYSGGMSLQLSENEQSEWINQPAPLVASEVYTPAASDKKAVDKQESRGYIDLRDKMEQFPADQRVIVSLLSEQSMDADDLIDRAQIPAARILASLTLLEVNGYVVRMAGRRYRLAYADEN